MLNDLYHPFADVQIELAKSIMDMRIEEAIRMTIRKKFDHAHLFTTQKACIEKATELGYHDLAEEMTTDFNLEREAYA